MLLNVTQMFVVASHLSNTCPVFAQLTDQNNANMEKVLLRIHHYRNLGESKKYGLNWEELKKCAHPILYVPASSPS